MCGHDQILFTDIFEAAELSVQNPFRTNTGGVAEDNQPPGLTTDRRSRGQRADLVFHDSDTKYAKSFDAALQTRGVHIRRHRPLSSNLNASLERWISLIKHECLDHFIVLGETHLNCLVEQYVEHYHTERPHQGIGIGNSLLVPRSPPGEDVPTLHEIGCRERLGGLLKSYSRRAA